MRKKSDIRAGVPEGQRSLQEFRKSNDTIAIRLSHGRLSLLSRKIFNVLVYNAQNGRGKGAGAPTQTETNKRYYWIPLAQLARDAAYESNDMLQFKESVQELQDFRIVAEDSTTWVSERLLSSVRLHNPHGLGSKGGQIYVGYAFPPEVEDTVMSPNSYTKMSIYYQGLLRRSASLALYESCRRYATNPTKVTNRNTPEWWFHVVTGAPVTERAPDYRYFKRDTLKPAIAEINAVTDIEIELIEHTQGRKVLELQFRVAQKRQVSLILEPVIDSALMGRLMVLGLSQDEASHIMSTTEDARLRATLDLTEKRMKSTKASPLESPAAYFKAALKENYASATEVAKKTVEKAKPVEDPDAKIAKIRDRYRAARAKDAYESYKELNDGERIQLFEEFTNSESAKGLNLARGLSNPSTRNAFSYWYVAKLWPAEPTELELLRFAAQVLE